jgi:predicted HTH transcriptional regulator
LIAQDVFITNIAISEKLTKSISTIERHIKMLKESNLLQRVGSKKTGHWKILK